MKLNEVPKVHTGLFPTPLYKLENLSSQLKSNIFIKRDDLSGLGFGGNKLRKLDYLVKEAKDNGYTALMTFGGVQTNHGRQTAACGRQHPLGRNGIFHRCKRDDGTAEGNGPEN